MSHHFTPEVAASFKPLEEKFAHVEEDVMILDLPDIFVPNTNRQDNRIKEMATEVTENMEQRSRNQKKILTQKALKVQETQTVE